MGGKPGLLFEFVLNTETDNYAQLTFSAMFRYEVEYMAEAEAALEAIPEAGSLTAENVKLLHENGVEINCWTCNSAESAAALIEWGVDYITTDYPERLQALLEQ